MTQWTPLDPIQHSDAGWFRFRDYAFTSSDHLAPVAMVEITQVLPWYPLAFIYNEQLDRYHLVALLSLQPGRNIYLGPQGKWQAPYIPSHFRGHPFALNAEGQLCIDTQSGLFAETQAIAALPIFDNNELAEPTVRVKEFHQKRQQALGVTQALINQLHQAGLISPWAIPWKAAGKPQTLKGYCAIDEERLRNLPPEDYAALVKSGALGLAYVQIFSRARVADLEHRHQRQPGQATADNKTQRHLHAVDSSDSLDALFGEDDDDMKFDF